MKNPKQLEKVLMRLNAVKWSRTEGNIYFHPPGIYEIYVRESTLVSHDRFQSLELIEQLARACTSPCDTRAYCPIREVEIANLHHTSYFDTQIHPTVR